MSEIKFLLDENLPYKLLDFLISEGYECLHIKNLGKAGSKNGEVYKLGADLKSFLITRFSCRAVKLALRRAPGYNPSRPLRGIPHGQRR